MNRVKVNPIFESMFVKKLKLRFVSDENTVFDAGIDIANIFGSQGEQDLFLLASCIFTGKEIK